MIHELKIYPQYYCRVADGSKTFEVRKNDRGFQPGDTVILREYNPDLHTVVEGGCHDLQTPTTWEEPIGYTDSEPLTFKVGYVLPIDAERVVFSLLKPEEK